MAERRMFTQKITESDAFLEMPATTQNLYFHLCMNADDDGFVSKPKAIMRCTGAKDDDANILIAKKFIIPFDSGVIVIKHWRMHNLLRKDRYTETAYKELKSQLFLDENGAYSQNADGKTLTTKKKKPLTLAQQKRLDARNESELPYSFGYKIRQAFIGEICPICGIKMGVPVVEEGECVVLKSPMPTIQHNIPISKGGKHSLDNISVICQKCNYSIQDSETGKLNNDLVIKKWLEIENGTGMATQYRKVKESIDKINIVYDADTHTTIQNLYNSICTNLVECKELTSKRKQLIKYCTYSENELKVLFQRANKSSFLQGNNSYGFKANFDWIMKKDNAIKVLEGIYDDSSSNNPKQNSQIISDKHEYSQDELENLFNKGAESNVDF